MTERSGGEHEAAAVVGGLVGSAIAWGLARVGMPEYAGWTKRSSEGWAGFAAELEEPPASMSPSSGRAGFNSPSAKPSSKSA